MKMAKKAFSVVLALVMLVNVFAAMSFAAGSESAVDLYITADKATYAPGDEIVFTVSEAAIAEVGNMQIAGTYVFGYNADAIAPISTGTTLEEHGFVAIADGYDSAASVIAATTDAGDIDSGNGWTDLLALCVCSDGSTDFDATSKTDLFTFKMKVADDAADGNYTIGFNSTSYTDDYCFGYAVDTAMGGIYGHSPYYSAAENYAFNNVTITVSSVTAPELDVTAASNQIRYNKNADGSFKGFDVRTRATINVAALKDLVGVTTDEELEELFNTGKAAAGFVYGADIDVATAATVAAGTAVDGYTKTTVSYIQNDGTNYVFTYLVTGLTTENAAASDFEAVGYITLTIDGTNYTFCYDAETAVSPSAMYNSTYERANTTFGWSLTAIS